MLRNFSAGSMVARHAQSSAKAVTVVRTAGMFFLATVLTHGGAANAAEIKIFTARAVATVLDKIGPEFERTTGHKLSVISGLSPGGQYAVMRKEGSAEKLIYRRRVVHQVVCIP